MQTQLIPLPDISSAEGAPGERPVTGGGLTPRTRASQQPRRRSKADSLRLAQRLKQAIAVGAIVAFGLFGGLVATRLPSLGTTASTASTSSTPTSTSASTTSGGFLGQGSSGSGVSDSGSSSSASSASSSSSTTPISGTSVS